MAPIQLNQQIFWLEIKKLTFSGAELGPFVYSKTKLITKNLSIIKHRSDRYLVHMFSWNRFCHYSLIS